jgi:hypothetical protein
MLSLSMEILEICHVLLDGESVKVTECSSECNGHKMYHNGVQVLILKTHQHKSYQSDIRIPFDSKNVNI